MELNLLEFLGILTC